MRLILLSACLLIMISTAPVNAQSRADVIIINGNVTTLDEKNPRAEAVVISKNRIAYVGNKKDALKYKDQSTQVIDARGRTIIPGLFDSHLHVIRGGRFYNSELRWDGVTTLKRALQILKEQAQRTPPGQWVRVVGGWNEFQFEEKRLPTLEEINAVTREVPTFVLYLYGKAWLNAAALQLLGINSDSPNPPGGLIEKDSAGNPTGLLIAEPNAFILYSTLARLPELTREEKVNSTIHYMRELNSLGVTAVMDAGGGFQNFPDDYGITDSLNNAGLITVRLPYFLFAQKKGSELSDFQKWTGMVDIEVHEPNGQNEIEYHVQGGGENIVAEAADFENFLLPRPDLPHNMEQQLKPVIELLVKKRWPFRLHATYNESISRDLTVIEQVNKETPLNGLTWMLDHAETISEENLQRVKALGGGIAIQHRMAYQGESFIRRYGKKAAAGSPPVKRMLELGIPVGLGTDGTRVASYNPWVALFWVTTGKTIGNTQVMDKTKTLSRISALELMTSRGYALIKEEHEKGKIQTGYYADIVILDKDYFTIPDHEIPDIASLLTIVDGRIVYGTLDYQHLAPPAPGVIPSWSPVKYYGGYQRK